MLVRGLSLALALVLALALALALALSVRASVAGAHVARPKCIGLDKWSDEEANRLELLGNAGANAYWEATYDASGAPSNVKKPTPTSSSSEVKRWIAAKYEKCRFLHPGAEKPATLPPRTPLPIP